MNIKEYRQKLQEAYDILKSLPTDGTSNIKKVCEYNNFFLHNVATAKANLHVAIDDLELQEGEITIFNSDWDR